ncbi:MAG: hypothetical protein R3B90_08690 [Planctomycetaceae bacterium]
MSPKHFSLEAVEPGQLIAVDSSRHDAVRLTNGAADRAVIGVASTHPGVLLGGGAFDVERIEQNWGKEHAERFRKEQAGLETRVLRLTSISASSRHGSESIETFSLESFRCAWMRRWWSTFSQRRPRSVPSPSSGAIGNNCRRGMRPPRCSSRRGRSCGDRSVPQGDACAVALAGRVPVQVDGSYGHIMAGDYLAPSPIPGVAMKASSPDDRRRRPRKFRWRTRVQMLVQRGWYGGESTHPAEQQLAGQFTA